MKYYSEDEMKQLAFYAVQHACKLGGLIHKSEIDTYLDKESELFGNQDLYLSVPFPDYQLFMEKHTKEWEEETTSIGDSNVLIPVNWIE